MQADDEELTEAMDAEVERHLDTTPQLPVNFQNTFGTDTSVAQQWIHYGLDQHTDEVNTAVESVQDTDINQDDDNEEYEAPVDSGYTAGDLATGTRVLLINHNESFYGAVGTVRKPVSDTLVSVEFDLKPNISYNVPAAHLQPYHDAAQTRQLLETTGGRWTFNGVPSLVQFLRAKQDTNGEWAFIGSVALSYWAREYGVPFRHPHDMDIVVKNLNGWYFDFGLALHGEPGAPSQKADHRTVELNMGTLDIIADGKGLGEFGGGPYMVGGVPVVSLQTIGYYKKKRGKAKDIEDLKVVDELIRRSQQ